jgi:hypothetical protein
MVGRKDSAALGGDVLDAAHVEPETENAEQGQGDPDHRSVDPLTHTLPFLVTQEMFG